MRLLFLVYCEGCAIDVLLFKPLSQKSFIRIIAAFQRLHYPSSRIMRLRVFSIVPHCPSSRIVFRVLSNIPHYPTSRIMRLRYFPSFRIAHRRALRFMYFSEPRIIHHRALWQLRVLSSVPHYPSLCIMHLRVLPRVPHYPSLRIMHLRVISIVPHCHRRAWCFACFPLFGIMHHCALCIFGQFASSRIVHFRALCFAYFPASLIIQRCAFCIIANTQCLALSSVPYYSLCGIVVLWVLRNKIGR